MQWVLSVDLLQNDSADANVLISSCSDWVGQGQEVGDLWGTNPTCFIAIYLNRWRKKLMIC